MTKEEILYEISKGDYEDLTSDTFVEQVVDALHIDVDYNYGATKGVLIFPEEDFVVKIPFAGYMIADEDTGEDYFSSFMFASDEECGNDYCRAEMVTYDKVAREHPSIAPLFAQTSFLGYIDTEVPVYIQPICTPSSSVTIEQKDEKIKQSASDSLHKYHMDLDIDWVADVITYYGKTVLDTLLSFLEDEQIEDLHSENIGYRKGMPIIFDYSDFRD